MSWYNGGWSRYVSAAERRKKAEREAAKLRKKGHALSPVVIPGRKIAATFWGQAWCENLESYRDFEYRLPRGRSYVRNRAVVDLQMGPCEVKALVSGSSLYKVSITIVAVPSKKWQAICRDCAGSIDSLVELLQGRLSKTVMERLCCQQSGLFPRPAEIKFNCSCPDYASMCKHVSAVLYGVGARLDEQPELLFRLRAVNENDLVGDLGSALPISKKASSSQKVLQVANIADLFGIDIESAEESLPPRPSKAPVKNRARKKTADSVVSGRKTKAPAARPVEKRPVKRQSMKKSVKKRSPRRKGK